MTTTFFVPKNGGLVESQPSLAERADGSIVVACNQDGRIRFDSLSPTGVELSRLTFLDTSKLSESSPSLAMDDNGNCVVAWSVARATPSDNPTIMASRVKIMTVEQVETKEVTQPDGTIKSVQVTVTANVTQIGPAYAIGNGIVPSVALSTSPAGNAGGGNFVVAYEFVGSTENYVKITEVTNGDTEYTTVYVGGARSAPCITINGFDQYFLTDTYDHLGTAPANISAQLGHLADYPLPSSGGGDSGGVGSGGGLNSGSGGGHIIRPHY